MVVGSCSFFFATRKGALRCPVSDSLLLRTQRFGTAPTNFRPPSNQSKGEGKREAPKKTHRHPTLLISVCVFGVTSPTFTRTRILTNHRRAHIHSNREQPHHARTHTHTRRTKALPCLALRHPLQPFFTPTAHKGNTNDWIGLD